MSHANPMPIPSHSIGHIGHARPTNPMPIPSKKYIRFMLYISSIFLVSTPLSVGHPAPPFTPLVRPRTAVRSRGARARRERSGSVAEAGGYSGSQRAAAPPCPSSAQHPARAAAKTAVSSRHPPMLTPHQSSVLFHVEHGGVLPPRNGMCPCA